MRKKSIGILSVFLVVVFLLTGCRMICIDMSEVFSEERLTESQYTIDTEKLTIKYISSSREDNELLVNLEIENVLTDSEYKVSNLFCEPYSDKSEKLDIKKIECEKDFISPNEKVNITVIVDISDYDGYVYLVLEKDEEVAEKEFFMAPGFLL